jgi:hypothetical protein
VLLDDDFPITPSDKSLVNSTAWNHLPAALWGSSFGQRF